MLWGKTKQGREGRKARDGVLLFQAGWSAKPWEGQRKATAHRADGIPTTGTNVDADAEVRVQLKDQQETGHCGAVRRGHADCGLCMVLVLPVRGSWLG